jgi:hypothetical protein
VQATVVTVVGNGTTEQAPVSTSCAACRFVRELTAVEVIGHSPSEAIVVVLVMLTVGIISSLGRAMSL